MLAQKKNITCESPIEKGYYNNEGRMLKLREICIHCGEGGSSDFLLSLTQLQECCMTDGYNSFPICTACLVIGKKVVKGGKKDNMQARNDKIAKVNAVK